MSQNDNKPTRTWQQIVEEASREKDPDKLQELAEELERALDQRRKNPHPESSQDPRST